MIAATSGTVPPAARAAKLSRLQKQILMLALRNRLGEGRDYASQGADLYYAQILAEVYCLPYPEGGSQSAGRRARLNFHMTGMGRRRYNAASQAVSRSMIRLEALGLIMRIKSTSCWRGCELTPEGVEMAAQVLGSPTSFVPARLRRAVAAAGGEQPGNERRDSHGKQETSDGDY